MSYQTVFDIGEVGYTTWWFPASGLIGIVLAMLALKAHNPAWWGDRRNKFFVGFAALWIVAAFLGTYRNDRRLRTAVDTGRVNVVEGVVSDFRPKTFGFNQPEHFCVGDTCFEYRDALVTGGFNHTGGPIREGLPVRVTFVESNLRGPRYRYLIVKLEVGATQ